VTSPHADVAATAAAAGLQFFLLSLCQSVCLSVCLLTDAAAAVLITTEAQLIARLSLTSSATLAVLLPLVMLCLVSFTVLDTSIVSYCIDTSIVHKSYTQYLD